MKYNYLRLQTRCWFFVSFVEFVLFGLSLRGFLCLNVK